MKTNSINNKVNYMTKNNRKTLANMLREDCENLIKVSKTERDENNNLLTYKDKSEKKEFFVAYKKARLHFGELARTEEGNKIAHIIFGKNAYDCVEFRIVEEYYLKAHPEDKGFFDASKCYDYCRRKTHEEKLQDRIAAANAAREAKRVKAVVADGRRNRRIIAIAIVILIAVAAFAVAVYKKGLKPVLKAIAFGACCVTVIFAFRKAQDAILDRIHKRFYGNK